MPHASSNEKEWVELHVPEGVDMTNYRIDDDTDFTSNSVNSRKKQVTSVVQGSDSKHQSSRKKDYPFSKQQVLIKGTLSIMPQVIVVSIGGLLLIGCGILLYFKLQGMWLWKKEE